MLRYQYFLEGGVDWIVRDTSDNFAVAVCRTIEDASMVRDALNRDWNDGNPLDAAHHIAQAARR